MTRSFSRCPAIMNPILTLLLVWGTAFTLQCTAAEPPSTSEVEDFDGGEADTGEIDFDNEAADIEMEDLDGEGEEDNITGGGGGEEEDYHKEEGGNIKRRQVPVARIAAPKRPPPATARTAPRRVTFTYSTQADVDVGSNTFDRGIQAKVGSRNDELYSEWVVVTRSGYEYSGSRSALRRQFQRARIIPAIPDDNVGGGPGDLDPVPTPVAERPRSSNLRGFFKRDVFRPDTRLEVTRPNVYPWSAMGRVESGCSGTFIGPRHVLTAGHCVFDNDTKKWKGNLDFRQAKNCNSHSGTLYRWRYAITVKGWTKYGDQRYDYGMIVVDRTSPAEMDIGYMTHMPRWIVNINGYPKDKHDIDRCMWHSDCRIYRVHDMQLGYKCDTAGGMSGSAVYMYWKESNRRVIYCIHAFGKSDARDYNKCTRITKPRYHQLKDWIDTY